MIYFRIFGRRRHYSIVDGVPNHLYTCTQWAIMQAYGHFILVGNQQLPNLTTDGLVERGWQGRESD